MYNVILSEGARNDFEQKILNQRQLNDISKLIDALKDAPFEKSHNAPNGDNEYYHRSTGKHELLYRVTNNTCIIIAIGWKDTVY